MDTQGGNKDEKTMATGVISSPPLSRNKSAMTTGLILGGALSLLLLLTFLFGNTYETQTNLGFVKWIIFFVIIFLLTKRYRDTHLNGFMSYGLSFNYGLISSVYASLILGFFTYIIYLTNSNLINEFFIALEEGYLQAGMEEDQVEVISSLMKKMVGPGSIAFITILSTIITGLITSLLTSILTKKNGANNNPFDSAMSEVES